LALPAVEDNSLPHAAAVAITPHDVFNHYCCHPFTMQKLLLLFF